MVFQDGSYFCRRLWICREGYNGYIEELYLQNRAFLAVIGPFIFDSLEAKAHLTDVASVHGDPPEVRRNALVMGVNLFVYALTSSGSG